MKDRLTDLEDRWRERTAGPNSDSAGLKSGGGGGTFDGMELVDAKIAAAEARTDAKFAEMLGELKALRADLSHMPSTTAMIGTMGGFTALAITIVLAVSALSGQMFGIGMDAQQVADRATQSMQPKIDSLQANYSVTNAKLDQLLKALSTDRSSFSPTPFQPKATFDEVEPAPSPSK